MAPVSSTEHEPVHGALAEQNAHDAHRHDEHAHGHGEHPSEPSGGGHENHHAEEFRRRFWISLALAVPVIAFSPMIRDWLGLPDVTGVQEAVAPVFGTILFFYGGRPFLAGAVSELRAREPGMMTLIALAISVAFVASAATVLGLLDLEFWWELAALIVIMLLGHWLEMRAVGQARGALQALAELLPDEAERVRDGTVETVPVSALAPGDVVLVRPGARVPADGEIVDGAADMDESMITGESRPVTRGEGDQVVAGTVATDSALSVRVDRLGEDTALAGIQRLVAEAQSSHSRAQTLADRAAAALFYVATAAGAVTFVVWTLLGELDDAITRTVTVLVISCPHALGLAIPLVIAIATSLAARAGVLVRDRLSLERMRRVDTVLFDKTGTLTRGEHVVVGMAATDGDEDALLALAAAAEAPSEHPLARAIVGAAREQSGSVPAGEDFRSLPGRGVEARVDGTTVAVGGPALLRELGVQSPPQLDGPVDAWRGRGAAVLHVMRDGQVAGALALEDQVRSESREAVDGLHQRAVRVAMVTGDARQVADAVGADLGIDEVFAEVLPQDKDAQVAELQQRGHTVAMVGDGVNDAPALARANVGIAIGAGTDVAIQSAGVVLASSDPRGVIGVIELSQAGYRKMLQNLAWAAGYNVIAIPLAAGVLAPVGVVLAPAVGAVLMSISTIVVAINAQLLRRLDLRPGRRSQPA
ncbi:MAG: heavy metal translocating P-type ATPase [Solirubrobacterales bacterium]